MSESAAPVRAEEPKIEEKMEALKVDEPKPVAIISESAVAPAVEKTDAPAVIEAPAATTKEIETRVVASSATPATEEAPAPISKEAVATPPSVPEKDVVAKTPTTPTPAAPVLTPLQELLALLPSITETASYSEMWGVTLTDHLHVPTTIVLEKFLRANNQDVERSKIQLVSALQWRKQMQPQNLLDAAYDSVKFGGLGFVTTYQSAEGEKEIITWNLYGAVKDRKATFGNIEEFVKWRCALMEISVKELDLASKTVAIPEGGVDPYRMIQVHDYLATSFLRQDSASKAATKETISTFSMAYPELLKEKFFVNVPALMGWVFSAMKLVLAPATVKKFHLLANGKQLSGELPSLVSLLPVAYGGKGASLVESGATPKYATIEKEATPEPVVEATPTAVEVAEPAVVAPAPVAVSEPVATPEQAATIPAAEPTATPAAPIVTPIVHAT